MLVSDNTEQLTNTAGHGKRAQRKGNMYFLNELNQGKGTRNP